MKTYEYYGPWVMRQVCGECGSCNYYSHLTYWRCCQNCGSEELVDCVVRVRWRCRRGFLCESDSVPVGCQRHGEPALPPPDPDLSDKPSPGPDLKTVCLALAALLFAAALAYSWWPLAERIFKSHLLLE